jgi:hypothetical protein
MPKGLHLMNSMHDVRNDDRRRPGTQNPLVNGTKKIASLLSCMM